MGHLTSKQALFCFYVAKPLNYSPFHAKTAKIWTLFSQPKVVKMHALFQTRMAQGSTSAPLPILL